MDDAKKLIDVFKGLTTQIEESSELEILIFNSLHFKYSIIKFCHSKNKKVKKNYQLSLQPDPKIFNQHIVAFISKFKTKGLILSLDKHQLNNQPQWDILRQLHFEKISLQLNASIAQSIFEKFLKYPKDQSNIKKLTQIILDFPRTPLFYIGMDIKSDQLLKAGHLIAAFSKKSHESQAQYLKYSKNSQPNQKFGSVKIEESYKATINLKDFHIQKLFEFIELWCQKENKLWQFLTQNDSFQSNFEQINLFFPEKLSESIYHPQKLSKNTLKNLINQTIAIYYKKQLVVSFNSCKDYGFNIIIGKSISIEAHSKRIIQAFLRFPFFVSFEIQQSLENLETIVSWVFHQCQNRQNYLLKINNQIQLTSYRLTLNSNNLSPKIVRNILKLLDLPGHYELDFYGTQQYLPQLTALFMRKPFVRFNYFIPISLLTPQILEVVKRMQKLAEDFKLKVIQFCCLLKDLNLKNIHTIQSIYANMHLQNL